MTFGHPSPLWLLLWLVLGAGAIIWLYLLRDQRRTLFVAFRDLWDPVLGAEGATRWRARLRRILSVLLQVLLLVLLLGALAEPAWQREKSTLRHWVFLVDASASMKARDVAPSRLGAAKKELLRFIDSMQAEDRVLVVRVDSAATPLSQFSSDRALLRRAVDGLACRDVGANWSRALAQARDLLRGFSDPRLVLVTDGAPKTRPVPGTDLDLGKVRRFAIPIGTSSTNVAITAMAARPSLVRPHENDLWIETFNADSVSHRVQLVLRGDGSVLDVRHDELGPGQRRPLVIEGLASASHRLESEIRLTDGAKDALAVDDKAWALVPEQRPIKVLVVSRGNTYLQAALLVDGLVDAHWVSPEEPWPQGPWDGAILDSVAPPDSFPGPALILGLPEGNRPLRTGAKLRDFGFDHTDRRDPLLTDLALEDVQVQTGHAILVEPGDRVLGASVDGPILVRAQRGGRPLLALGFDPRRSDFVLRPAWPLFITNAVHGFLSRRTDFLSAFTTRTPARVTVPSQANRAWLVGLGEQPRPVPIVSHQVTIPFDRVGVYRLEFEPQGALGSELAVNLGDAEESNIAPASNLKFGSQELPRPEPTTVGDKRPLWWLLLAVAATVVLLEWLSYHRRWTV